MLLTYRVWTRPKFALALLGLGVGAFLVSLPDPNFRAIVTKPDNVPIVALIFILGFFLWWSLRQAAINDERLEQGLPPREAEEANDRILVWPDLVYEELICMVILSVVLIVWSIYLKAPLEEPANPGKTPNPSKAPWYFLGLQEMLVYFDPWIAGVVLPGMIISGLILVPYCDKNPRGMGYYTLKERPFAVGTFLFGFCVLWVMLIIMGTFLRGPNWNFFGPYEPWDSHKLESLSNVNLSEYFWVHGLKRRMPEEWFMRELPGIFLVSVYLFAGPALLLLAPPVRRMYQEIGFLRYGLVMVHLLPMAAMVIKMILRWTINLKYVIFIPEYFFNI
ncbi:MAG: cytochrome C [Planctomycetes bacterium]|nr:cytochrome C [Planctomycetota bacterium]